MKFGIIKAALLVVAVSVTGSHANAASEAKEKQCREKFADLDRSHPCRASLKTQESYKQNKKFIQCIKKMKKKCLSS